LEQQFTEMITDQLETHKNRLNDAADQLNLLVNQLITDHKNRLNISRIQLANLTQSFLKVQQSELKQLSIETKNKTSRFVTRQNHLLDSSGNKLNFIFREQVLKNRNLMKQFEQMLRIHSLELIRSEKKNLHGIGEKLRLVDPMNILKRGYSLTLINGKIVKSVDQVNQDDRLETRLSDGKVESTVNRISNKE
jgi:exodeoxyribonuclease VII large subunit